MHGERKSEITLSSVSHPVVIGEGSTFSLVQLVQLVSPLPRAALRCAACVTPHPPPSECSTVRLFDCSTDRLFDCSTDRSTVRPFDARA